jgi:hypothetical protein
MKVAMWFIAGLLIGDWAASVHGRNDALLNAASQAHSFVETLLVDGCKSWNEDRAKDVLSDLDNTAG